MVGKGGGMGLDKYDFAQPNIFSARRDLAGGLVQLPSGRYRFAEPISGSRRDASYDSCPGI